MTVDKILCALLLVVAVATADPYGVATAKDLVIQQQGDVSYVSGGVGEEKEALAAASRRFNLKVTMALASGHFVGDARVLIEDAHGRPVLDTTADGPLLYAQLQPGTYTVHCSLNGKEVRQTAHVGGSGQQAVSCTWSAE
jgi:hypothetical protein